MPPDAQLPAEREWVEQLVAEQIQGQLKTFAEGVGQGIAEMRALLRNEIAAAEARAAWGAEHHIEKLEEATLSLLQDVEARLARLESATLQPEQQAALPIEHRLAALERRATPLLPQKPRLIAGRGADDAA